MYVPPLTVIGKNVFIGPGAAFTNDPYPMSPTLSGVVVSDGAIVGAGTLIKAGVHHREQCCGCNGIGRHKRRAPRLGGNGRSRWGKVLTERL